MLRTVLASLCLTAGLAAAAPAQTNSAPPAVPDAPQPPAGGGRMAAQLREACAADAQKYCPDLGRGPERRACMREHQAQLTQPCRDAMAAVRSALGARRGGGN